MTNPTQFRLFEPTSAEYEAIVAVYNAATPSEVGSAATWRHWDQHRDPARQFTRHVAERGGVIGGYGYTVRTDPRANAYSFAHYLEPTWKTPEFIEAFYRYLVGFCLASAPASLLCQTREDEPLKVAWLKAQGFRPVMRYPRSTLVVAGFDPKPFAAAKTRVAAAGITIVSLVELAGRDEDWQQHVYDLWLAVSADVPRPTAFVPPSLAQYVQRRFKEPSFLPETWLIALDGPTYVGATSLFRAGDTAAIMETGFTGVRRAYRRRGLATTLKCQAIEAARALGTRLIHTSNEENNPMFQLNLRLGFVAQAADIDWEKRLAPG